MKYCPFRIDGPTYQRLYGSNVASRSFVHTPTGMERLHTMQDWERSIHPTHPDYIMMPRVRFQAELTYQCLSQGRVLMRDAYERTWSVFASDADKVLPAMRLGVLNAWWVMAKKGKAYGLTVELETPLVANLPSNLDIPLMLEKTQDMQALMPYFEAMAV